MRAYSRENTAYPGRSPYTGVCLGGSHEITNGLLLRTDIHRLFDLGYVTIASNGRFEVGKRLREDFENGQHYYQMHGQSLWMPPNPSSRPSREALEWHQNYRFLG